MDLKVLEEEVVPKVDDVSLVDGVFDGAFSGDGEEDFVMGECVVVSSSLLVRLEWKPWRYGGGEENYGEDDEEHGEGDYLTRMNGIKEVLRSGSRLDTAYPCIGYDVLGISWSRDNARKRRIFLDGYGVLVFRNSKDRRDHGSGCHGLLCCGGAGLASPLSDAPLKKSRAHALITLAALSTPWRISVTFSSNSCNPHEAWSWQ
ncbi:hypothetical protein Tco_0663795 [Tanacetum coccineum]